MGSPSVPVLNLSWATDPDQRPQLLQQLHSALFDVGFLYIINHGVPPDTILDLADRLPSLFALPDTAKRSISKLNSPHFLGYSGFAEETTLGKKDLREQFDFATELPAVYQSNPPSGNASSNTPLEPSERDRDFSKLYWRLRGPNQWPSDTSMPGFREALTRYHDALQDLSSHFVHLIEEAFGIPTGTFNHFFGEESDAGHAAHGRSFLPPQHRIKLLCYPPSATGDQGVGAHKDSSGWLTFLYQVGSEPGLEVLSSSGRWLPVQPIENSFVVNFGNAFEAATEGAVKATVHRVVAPGPNDNVRYSIPFFQGLPLDMTLSEIRKCIPAQVRRSREQAVRSDDHVSTFLDGRWDNLGQSQMRKWIRSHKDVAMKHYDWETVEYYTVES